jgi:hypothetical protein
MENLAPLAASKMVHPWLQRCQTAPVHQQLGLHAPAACVCGPPVSPLSSPQWVGAAIGIVALK